MYSRVALAAFLVVAAVSAQDSVTPIAVSADGATDFRLGDDLVTGYHTWTQGSQPYLWPLNAPGGIAVSRAWPIEKANAVTTDHPHHVSAWFCHGDVSGIDFWSISPRHGVIAVTDAGKPEGSRVRTRNEWRAADGRRLLDETRTIALRAVPTGRLIVVTSDLTPASEAITFGDTKEGSFAVRVSDQMRVGDKKVKNAKSQITNADGKQGEKECWGYPSDWCDYSGEVDGKAVGVAIFDDPTNKPRACWHVRDYGLMAANPFGRAKSGFPAMRNRNDVVRLDKGENLRLRYGIYLHNGDAKTGKVAEAFERFVKLRD
jgi:hypothetical protein